MGGVIIKQVNSASMKKEERKGSKRVPPLHC